ADRGRAPAEPPVGRAAPGAAWGLMLAHTPAWARGRRPATRGVRTRTRVDEYSSRGPTIADFPAGHLAIPRQACPLRPVSVRERLIRPPGIAIRYCWRGATPKVYATS